KFRVTKTWLSDNGLTQNDVALWRYKDNKWNVLVTTMASSDETYVYYGAETPGFSYFAIGSKAVAPEEVPEEEVPEEEVPEEEVQPEVPTPKPIEAPSKTTWPGWATFLVIVVVGLVIYFVFVKKKKE
ncbi:MAG: PGF-pre-PGF domain-containing protein, partial [Candidatus Woesearchaeota archaeon]